MTWLTPRLTLEYGAPTDFQGYYGMAVSKMKMPKQDWQLLQENSILFLHKLILCLNLA